MVRMDGQTAHHLKIQEHLGVPFFMLLKYHTKYLYFDIMVLGEIIWR